MKKDLNELAKQVHQANLKWWQDPKTGQPIERNRYELLALVISEVCEALEGERKNLMDDHLPHRKMAEVEMADAYIRLMDFAGGFGVTVWDDPVDYGTLFQVSDIKGAAMFDLMVKITQIAGDASSQGYRISAALYSIDLYCEKHGYDLMSAVEEKLTYNSKRADHTHAARLAAGGKQF